MSELQDLYESINPIPENLSRCGDGYCQHVYMLIDPYASGYKARFEGFKQGLQHQQSKVDELQRQTIDQGQRFNEQSQRIKDLEHKNEELQNRVDAAIYLLTSIKAENDLWGCDQVERQIELLEQALKGEQP